MIPRPDPTVRRWIAGVAGASLWLSLATAACEDPPRGPTAGSNSNWLSSCATAADCGEGDCRCGLCTPSCATDADCAELPSARCGTPSSPATWAQCQTRAPDGGLCLAACEPGDCAAGSACASGACVRVELPANEFCAAVTDPDRAAHTAEDALLEALQALRRAGTTNCGAGAPGPLAELRLDARLVCAARVLAAELAETRTQSLVDGAGRDTAERLALAEYAATTWGEAFAFEAADATAALATLTAEATSCPLLIDPVLVDVGVGRSGDVLVVTFAAGAP